MYIIEELVAIYIRMNSIQPATLIHSFSFYFLAIDETSLRHAGH